MKHRIFHFPTFSNEPPVEVKNIELFTTRVGYPCYHIELNLFDRYSDTNSGWIKKAVDPQTGTWVEFPYRSHYTNFYLYSSSMLAQDRALTVYLIPESKEEEDLVSNCQTSVRWEPWAFRVCLIPNQDFYPPSKNEALSPFH